MNLPSPPTSDIGLENAEALVARIFDFVASEKSRLSHFLKVTGLSADALDDLGASQYSFLNVLDSVASDPHLLTELETHERITSEQIALARARLAFEATAAATNQSHDAAAELAIREKVKNLLRALTQLMQERKAAPERRSASGI
jgi:hypothetical protein